MAENQTATEDSGQSQQQQQQNQNQQPQSPQQEQQPPALSSPTSPSQEDSASSPDDSQTIAIPNTNHHPHHHNQMQEQTQSRSLIDRQISGKFKTSSASAQRRNTIQTPARAVSTTAIKKPPLTKMSSMSGSATGGGSGGSTVLNADSKHHPQHHHYHNSTSNHHHSSSTSASAAIQRTTSESLRLNAMPGGSAGESSSTSNLSNATSNSSLHSHLSNSTGSSTSVAPQSTTTTASTSKTTSPNNNASGGGGGGGAGAGSLASRSHQSHSSHHHSHSSHHHHHHGQASSQPSRKPKTSSFQITSVTVGQAKLSSDNGDESADDLDESHTDDNSRITDVENETPSVSEDTFSKEEVYFSNNALSTTAPVIPTSSQYGLVVVDPIGPNLGQTIQNVQVNVSDNIINVVSAGVPGEDGKKKDDGKDTQHRSERFKVVKIESTEPFRRGRWMCMDYLDHSAVGTGGKEGANNNDKTVSSESGSGGSGEPSKTTQSMIIGTGAAGLLENHVDATSNNLQLTGNAGANEGNWNFSETSTNQQPGNVPSGVATAPATVVHGMQQFITGDGGQQQQQPYSDNVNANASGEAVHGQTMPMDYAAAAAQQLQQSLKELKKQEEAIAAESNDSSGSIYVPGQSQPVNFVAQQLPQQQSMSQQQQQQQQPQQQQQQHAATLPSNMHFQNGAISVVTDTAGNNNNGQEIEKQEEQPQQHQTAQQQPALQTLGMSYVPVESQQQQSQPLSPALQSAPTEAPSFIPVDGSAYNQQNFQQLQQQPPPIIPSDAIHLQTQQHSQPQQQQQHSPPQIKQQISQTDGVVTSIQQQQAPQQFQQQIAAGQTLPILSQMPSYEMQAGQNAAASSSIATAATTITTTLAQTQQSAPATIADPTAIVTTLQAQQPAAAAAAISPNATVTDTENATLKTTAPTTTTATANAPNEQQLPSVNLNTASVSANSSNNNNNANSNNNISTNLASAAVASNSTTSTGVDEQTQQQPLQSQLQPNTETTETERNPRLSQNLISPGSNRKRALSTPHISPAISNFLNTTNANFATLGLGPNPIDSSEGNTTDRSSLMYYTQTASGRVSFCVDDSQWPNTQGRSADSNIFTNLALGDDRFRLPLNTAGSNCTTRESSLALSEEFQDASEGVEEHDKIDEDDEDENDEAIDQFSPTIYAAKLGRSIPIPISAGNSPQHITAPMGGGGLQTPQLMSPTHHAVAFSGSPTTGAHPYSPFYCGSPEALASAPQMGVLDGSLDTTTKLSFSYDPALSAAIQRLPLPNVSRQHSHRTSPVEEGSTSPAVTATALVFPVYSSASASATVSPTNSASGTSAVAIDNKIEQAMDLVKSHLMIAVREEVEVLKEKISELMDKINQLEVENTILKANMSQETLQQLQMQTQLQIAGNGTPAGSNMIAAAPQPPTATQQQQQANVANTNATVAAAANATPAAAAALTAVTATAIDTAAVAAAAAAVATVPAVTATTVTNTAATTTNGPMS